VVAGKRISPMGYIIQVGAFSVLENAVRLTETAQNKDLTVYSFGTRLAFTKSASAIIPQGNWQKGRRNSTVPQESWMIIIL